MGRDEITLRKTTALCKRGVGYKDGRMLWEEELLGFKGRWLEQWRTFWSLPELGGPSSPRCWENTRGLASFERES